MATAQPRRGGHAVSLTAWVLIASASAFVIKLAGYLLPRSVLDRPQVIALAKMMTVGLLASLTIMNTVSSGQRLTPMRAWCRCSWRRSP